MKKFKLIRSNLYPEKQNYISTLKIENDDYYVAFNYFCDYMGDLKIMSWTCRIWRLL